MSFYSINDSLSGINRYLIEDVHALTYLYLFQTLINRKKHLSHGFTASNASYLFKKHKRKSRIAPAFNVINDVNQVF